MVHWHHVSTQVVTATLAGRPELAPGWAQEWLSEWVETDQDLRGKLIRRRIHAMIQDGSAIFRRGDWLHRSSGRLILPRWRLSERGDG
jgi:hypothetical protein